MKKIKQRKVRCKKSKVSSFNLIDQWTDICLSVLPSRIYPSRCVMVMYDVPGLEATWVGVSE